MKRFAYVLVLIVMVMAAGGAARAQVAEKSEGTAPADTSSGKQDFGLEIFGGRAKLAAIPSPRTVQYLMCFLSILGIAESAAPLARPDAGSSDQDHTG